MINYKLFNKLQGICFCTSFRKRKKVTSLEPTGTVQWTCFWRVFWSFRHFTTFERFEIDELTVNLKSMNSHVQRQSLENPIANNSKPRIKTTKSESDSTRRGQESSAAKTWKREGAERPFLFPETRHLFFLLAIGSRIMLILNVQVEIASKLFSRAIRPATHFYSRS